MLQIIFVALVARFVDSLGLINKKEIGLQFLHLTKTNHKTMIIKATIDRFEGEKAVLKTEDNENIIWPKSKLPNGLKEGSSLMLAAIANKNDGDADNKLAKDILNEILAAG